MRAVGVKKRKDKKDKKRPKRRNFALERRKLKRGEKREKRRKQELSTRPTVGNCVGASSLEIGPEIWLSRLKVKVR